ncbi:MAG TPA: glycosyltransferase [Gemmataceae bacterium]|nr:glycosyltransferase [Gemmataceae bacterium]
MDNRPLRILSNIEDLEKGARPGLTIEHSHIDPQAGSLSAFRLFWRSLRQDAILLDANPRYLWLLCLLRWLWPLSGCRLISLDIIFVKPRSWKETLQAWFRKQLLRRVDHFVHYFKDLSGYRRYFGIGDDRSTYVPFKVNGWDKLPSKENLSSNGAYVFTGGRSLRDLDTFLAAMRLLPYPAVLLYHDLARMEANGTPVPFDRLPPNVRAVEDNGRPESWLRHLNGAKVVVLTTLPSSIRAVGISTYLDAMALGKCVVMTDGPATNGLIKKEAILVSPCDAAALAEAIRAAWEDDTLREATARAGRRYAETLEGNTRLLRDVLRVCAEQCGIAVGRVKTSGGAE